MAFNSGPAKGERFGNTKDIGLPSFDACLGYLFANCFKICEGTVLDFHKYPNFEKKNGWKKCHHESPSGSPCHAFQKLAAPVVQQMQGGSRYYQPCGFFGSLGDGLSRAHLSLMLHQIQSCITILDFLQQFRAHLRNPTAKRCQKVHKKSTNPPALSDRMSCPFA